MKLSALRINNALDQLDPRTAVIQDSHPSAGELKEFFGNHTFFVDGEGLEIIEPTDADEEPAGREVFALLRVATWNDADRTRLTPHPAEATGRVITFPSTQREALRRAGEDSFPASDPTMHSGVTGPDDLPSTAERNAKGETQKGDPI